MTTREDLIEKLVITLHLNVPERQRLGTNHISFDEVAAVVKRLLIENGAFPARARSWKQGELVVEGFFLVKRPDGTVEMNQQRSHPSKPTQIAEQSSAVYDDLDQAISMFIKSEWSNGIDGIGLTLESER